VLQINVQTETKTRDNVTISVVTAIQFSVGDTHKDVCIFFLTNMHKYIYTYIHVYICTYIHIYIYTYIHVYMYTYIHTPAPSDPLNPRTKPSSLDIPKPS